MNTDNDILKLQSINDIMGMNFYIPSYQRGYRWKPQQVKDLLDDIWEFYEKDKMPGEIYCVQPLVVKRKADDTFRKIKEEAKSIEEVESLLKGYWEVIDGQQRLTTLYIILSYLQPNIQNKYRLEYATRNPEDRKTEDSTEQVIGSKEFLLKLDREGKDIDENTYSSNIDFYHMYNAYNTVLGWVDQKKKECKDLNDEFKTDELLDIIKNQVKFIWYETDEPDPIDVFTRLNIGKISLTDSELIKALFLNQSNFKGDMDSIRLQQLEIAGEWDNIEKTLQDEEFWLFIHDIGWSKPTRIEWIFDMIVKKKAFGDMGDCGTDNHRTFRYFYEFFKRNKKEITAKWIKNTWNEIRKYFMVFKEWYNDFELYHYIGFLIQSRISTSDLIDKYEKKEKDHFKKFLKDKIKGILKDHNCTDLYRDYGENGKDKRDCFPLLLLFNIQTVINQNKEFIKDKKYGMGAYYRFPFHLFKKEAKKSNSKGWEVEHIASNAGDNLESPNREIWLASVLYSLPVELEEKSENDENNSEKKKTSLKTEIEQYLDNDKHSDDDFGRLKAKIDQLDIQPLDDIDKQKIWNFTLLDSSTNEEYQNDPFPIKRICVIAKENGRKAVKMYDSKTRRICIDKQTEVIAFVPPCTKNIFIKEYTDLPISLTSWTKQDAECYLRKLEEVLCEFIYPEVYNLPEKYRRTLFTKNRIIANISCRVLKRYIERCENIINQQH